MIAANIQQVIPPTGISILIFKLFILIPGYKSLEIAQRRFIARKRKCILHAKKQIPQGEQRRLSKIHPRSFFHLCEKLQLVEILHLAHVYHSFATCTGILLFCLIIYIPSKATKVTGNRRNNNLNPMEGHSCEPPMGLCFVEFYMPSCKASGGNRCLRADTPWAGG